MKERVTQPLAPEAVVELRDSAGPITRWFCTPEHLDELAVGWLVGEGLAESAHDVGPIEADPASSAVLLPAPRVDLRGTPSPVPAGGRGRTPGGELFDPEDLGRLFGEMFALGSLREQTGGIHTGALVDGRDVKVVREDVSRHCVVDKLIGHATLAGSPLDRTVLLLTGRISGAIAAKGARAGLLAMATMSIPTTLAASLAGRTGMTLVGRARSVSPHVYVPES